MKILDFLFKKLFWKPFPADTLGSVGVIISTLLMDNFGWQRADPIASIFIAIMTLISVKPLLTETTQVLLQRSPAELDSKLPQIYQQLATIGLVTSVPEIKIHFWTTDMMFHMICNIWYIIYLGIRKWILKSSKLIPESKLYYIFILYYD